MTNFQGQMLSRRWRPRQLTRVDRPRLLILHVPKTGGSTLRSMIDKHVPAEETFLSTGKQQWIGSSVAEMQAMSAFVGHSFTVPLSMLPEDRWVSVLPVREPLSWWTSWYKYQRRELSRAGTVDHPMLAQSMDEWVRSCDDEALSNPQSSWLLTRQVLSWDHPLTRPGRLTDTVLMARPPARQVARVLETLVQRVSVVGTTDDLLSMYLRTCACMGWEPLFQEAVRENVSKAAPGLVALGQEQTERLAALNRLDRHLYEMAASRGAGRSVGPSGPRSWLPAASRVTPRRVVRRAVRLGRSVARRPSRT